jgi:hypothetical protein
MTAATQGFAPASKSTNHESPEKSVVNSGLSGALCDILCGWPRGCPLQGW